MNLNIDTQKMRECGNDLLILTIELNTLFTELFERLEKISDVSGEWVGLSANQFISQVKVDKVQYFNLNNSIAKEAKLLIKASDELDTYISKLKR